MDSLSASVISEMLAAAEAEGELLPPEAEIPSESEDGPEEALLPDNGVFT